MATEVRGTRNTPRREWWLVDKRGTTDGRHNLSVTGVSSPVELRRALPTLPRCCLVDVLTHGRVKRKRRIFSTIKIFF